MSHSHNHKEKIMFFNIFMLTCLVCLGILVTMLVVNLEQKTAFKTLTDTDIDSFVKINTTLENWKKGTYNPIITTSTSKNGRI